MLYVYGSANDITLFGGNLRLFSSGAVASKVTVVSGGFADIWLANASNFYISGASAAVSSGATLYSGTVKSANGSVGSMAVYRGGEANKVTVDMGGRLSVSSGGTISGTSVLGGSLGLAGTADATSIYSGASATVNSSGYASNTLILGGMLTVLGGIANYTSVSSGGVMDLLSGGTAAVISVLNTGKLNVGNSGRANSAVVSTGGSMIVSRGGRADSATVNGGIMIVQGGTAYNTAVTSFGSMVISSGSAASGTTATADGMIFIESGGYAESLVISSGGMLYVSSGGTANILSINSSAMVFASSGGLVVCANVFGGRFGIYNGAVANTTVVAGGQFYVSSGAVASGVGVLGGSLTVSSGGKLTGRMIFDTGFGSGTIEMMEGSILDFDLTQTSTDESAEPLLDSYQAVSGSFDVTLTVGANQALGTYKLTDDATAFDKTITVKDLSGASLGTLSLGQAVTIGDVNYTLTLTSNDLDVTLTTAPGPGPTPVYTSYEFFAGDFNGDGLDMLAVETTTLTGETKVSSVTIYMNGEPWGLGLSLDPGWDVVAIGDFNADHLDDFLRVNDDGYVVGEMSNGNGTFVPQVLNYRNPGWEILGVGDFNGNGSDDVLIANPVGASDTVGLLGYWESGVTWTLINGYSPEWECVSTGDFNGDGKCDMLWRNSFVGEGDLIYNAYCTWIVDNPVDWRMVSVADPAEWDFLCSGDFDGNGSHDIAMINAEGVVGIWGVGDGYLNSWSILSAVDRSTWTLAGVADFNGDGTDDIAWASDALGVVGYWQINNKELADWQNIANLA